MNDDYSIVTTAPEFEAMLQTLREAELIAFDLETTGFEAEGYGGPDSDKIVGWAISVRSHQAWYVPVRHLQGQQLDADEVTAALKPILEDPHKTFVNHNAKFDTHFVQAEGIKINLDQMEDSMLEAAVLGYKDKLVQVGLKYITMKVFHHKQVAFTDLFGPKEVKNIARVNIDKAGFYACEDADYCLRLHLRYYEYIQRHRKLRNIYNLERRLWPLTRKIEDTGVPVDKDFANSASAYLRAEAAKIYGVIVAQIRQHDPNWDPADYKKPPKKKGVEASPWLVGFNPGSSQQLAAVIQGVLGLRSSMTTKAGAPSFGRLALERLALQNPVARNLMTYKSMIDAISKLQKEILGSIKYDNRAHTNYNQVGTRSGRYSSTNPNFQNLSREKKWTVVNLDGSTYVVALSLRDAFAAQDGYYLIECDFSAIEFVIFAKLAGDKSVVSAYEGGIVDVHKQTAQDMLGIPYEQVQPTERDLAKQCNYLTIYGGGGGALMLRTGQTRVEADQTIERFFEVRPRFRVYGKRVLDEAKRDEPGNPYATIETLSGRRIYVYELEAPTAKERSKGERAAINGKVQGTAADVHKSGLLRSVRAVGERFSWEDACMILQTHDSQTWQVSMKIPPQEIVPIILEAMPMQHPELPKVKVDCKIGVTWGSTSKYEAKLDYRTVFPVMKQAQLDQIAGFAARALSEEPEKPEEEPKKAKKVGIKLLLEPGQEITKAQGMQCESLFRQFPGKNVIAAHLGDGYHDLVRSPVSLGAKELEDLIRGILPQATVTADRSQLLLAAGGALI